MGKVRTEMVKRISADLIDKYPYSFTNEFQNNKEFLVEIRLDISKKLRNKIAGYITTIIRSELASEGESERRVTPLVQPELVEEEPEEIEEEPQENELIEEE